MSQYFECDIPLEITVYNESRINTTPVVAQEVTSSADISIGDTIVSVAKFLFFLDNEHESDILTATTVSSSSEDWIEDLPSCDESVMRNTVEEAHSIEDDSTISSIDFSMNENFAQSLDDSSDANSIDECDTYNSYDRSETDESISSMQSIHCHLSEKDEAVFFQHFRSSSWDSFGRSQYLFGHSVRESEVLIKR